MHSTKPPTTGVTSSPGNTKMQIYQTFICFNCCTGDEPGCLPANSNCVEPDF